MGGTLISTIPVQGTGKGRGQRNKKNIKQIDYLTQVFKAKQIWTNGDVAKLAACTGLTRSQVYKWNWDMRKKTCPELLKPPKVKKKSSQMSPRAFLKSPTKSKAALETIKEISSPLFPPIIQEKHKKHAQTKHTSRNVTPLPKLHSAGSRPVDLTPYLEQKTAKPEKKKSSKKIRLNRIEKLQKRFEFFTIDEPRTHESEFSTRTSARGSEQTPQFGSKPSSSYSHNHSCIKLKDPLDLFLRNNQKKDKKPAPPTTPEQYSPRQQMQRSLLKPRNYSQAHLFDDDCHSIPEYFENMRIEEEDPEDQIEAYLKERQRSNSVGELSSQQTQNLLDKYLFENEAYLEDERKQPDSSFSNSLKPINSQFMPVGYFRFESTSSGNTIMKRHALTNKSPLLEERIGSDNSWKNIQFNRDASDLQHTGSSEYNNQSIVPRNLSAQVRIIPRNLTSHDDFFD